MKRDTKGGWGLGVMEGKESKSESREMPGGDAVGQSGPFLRECVFTELQ